MTPRGYIQHCTKMVVNALLPKTREVFTKERVSDPDVIACTPAQLGVDAQNNMPLSRHGKNEDKGKVAKVTL